MARPRVESPKKTISARVSPELEVSLSVAADRCGLTLSVYLGNFWADPANNAGAKPALEKPRKTLAPAVVLDAGLRRELANIGNNINQVARALSVPFGRESLATRIDLLGRMTEVQRDLHRLVESLSMPKEGGGAN
jgi:hypothetical protein